MTARKGIVLAGGEGSRMEVLTQDRAKPALPFAGVFRLLDFPLSNLRNSGVDDIRFGTIRMNSTSD